jgi:hypothetical protein
MSYSDIRVDEVLKLVDEMVQVPEPAIQSFQPSGLKTMDHNNEETYIEILKQIVFDFTGGMRSRL